MLLALAPTLAPESLLGFGGRVLTGQALPTAFTPGGLPDSGSRDTTINTLKEGEKSHLGSRFPTRPGLGLCCLLLDTGQLLDLGWVNPAEEGCQFPVRCSHVISWDEKCQL